MGGEVPTCQLLEFGCFLTKRLVMDVKGLLSVIVPVYNVELYLAQCLDSLLSQTYSRLEIILVNDGSTDSSPEICLDYARKDDRLKVVHKPNGGLSSARNYGMQYATGEYVAFLDSDDWLEVDIYRLCMQAFLDDPKLDLCIFAYANEFLNESIVIDRDVLIGADRDAVLIALENPVSGISPCVWNKVYRHSLIRGLTFPEGRVYEDLPYTHQVLRRTGKLLYLPIVGVHYRRTNAQSISYTIKENIMDVCTNLENLRSLYESQNDLEGVRSVNSLLITQLRQYYLAALNLPIADEYRQVVRRAALYPWRAKRTSTKIIHAVFLRSPRLSFVMEELFVRGVKMLKGQYK